MLLKAFEFQTIDYRPTLLPIVLDTFDLEYPRIKLVLESLIED